MRKDLRRKQERKIQIFLMFAPEFLSDLFFFYFFRRAIAVFGDFSRERVWGVRNEVFQISVGRGAVFCSCSFVSAVGFLFWGNDSPVWPDALSEMP